jgi:hypothetical protein
MPSPHYNHEVVKRLKYHMFTSVVPGLFSTRLSLVILTRIIKLPLRFRQIRGWADRPAIISRNTEFIGPRIRRAELILPFLHDVSGRLSGEQKARCGEHPRRSTTGVKPVGLHRRKDFQSRDDPGWQRRHPSIRVALGADERRR